MPLTTATIILRYLGINLTKNVKDLYLENYKILKKEVELAGVGWREGEKMQTNVTE